MTRHGIWCLLAVAALVRPCGAQARLGQAALAERLRPVIERHLGRPYAWGGAGLKSFDCSGFVWRVMLETGTPIKRTTARKMYMSLPQVRRTERFAPGNVVFFDNLTHCGLVNSRSDFFHSQLTRGSNLSEFDPYWRPKICGFRRIVKP